MESKCLKIELRQSRTDYSVNLTSLGGESMIRKLGVAGVIAVLLSLVFAGLALALSITVDGTISPQPMSGELAIRRPARLVSRVAAARLMMVVDVLGPQVDWYDIENVHVTNNSSNLYLRVDFYGDNYAAGPASTPGISNTWKTTASGRPLMTICLDIDASGTNSSNGATGSDLPPGLQRWRDHVWCRLRCADCGRRPNGLPALPRIYAWDNVGPWSAYS